MQEVTALQKEKNTGVKLGGIASKLAAHPLLLAFLINLAAFLVRILLFDIKYEVSDDYINDAVLSGAFGNGYDPHLLFGNVIIGYVLVFLYKLIPVISFYLIMLLALGFCSVTAVLYLLFKKKVNTITVCIAIIFLALVTDDLYVLLQFTKVAAAAGVAGGLLILHGLWEAKKNKILIILLGAVLMITGSMVRSSTIYIFAAFLGLQFICYTVVHFTRKENNKRVKASKKDIAGALLKFCLCVALIGLMFAINSLGEYINTHNEKYREFNAYHDLRTAITDKTIPDFDDVETAYANEFGFDGVDYVMLGSWNFDDREVYPDETLKRVAEINSSVVASHPMSIGDILHVIFSRGEINYPAAFALYIPALLALVLDKKRSYYIVLVLASFAMLAGFVVYGRTMYRIEWSVYFCAASCAVAAFDYDESASKVGAMKKKLFGKERGIIAVYTVMLVVLLMFTRIPRVLQSFTLLSIPEEDCKNVFDNTMIYSGEFLPLKVSFPSVKRKPSPNLIEYIENDDEHFYYIDFATGIQDLYFDYDPWIRPEQGLFCDEYAYFGGCTMRHPGEIYALEKNGSDPYSPFKSLTNENIYLVDNWGALYKAEYVRRYYNPNVQIEEICEIDGYKIWNFYISDDVPENETDIISGGQTDPI